MKSGFEYKIARPTNKRSPQYISGELYDMAVLHTVAMLNAATKMNNNPNRTIFRDGDFEI